MNSSSYVPCLNMYALNLGKVVWHVDLPAVEDVGNHFPILRLFVVFCRITANVQSSFSNLVPLALGM